MKVLRSTLVAAVAIFAWAGDSPVAKISQSVANAPPQQRTDFTTLERDAIAYHRNGEPWAELSMTLVDYTPNGTNHVLPGILFERSISSIYNGRYRKAKTIVDHCLFVPDTFPAPSTRPVSHVRLIVDDSLKPLAYRGIGNAELDSARYNSRALCTDIVNAASRFGAPTHLHDVSYHGEPVFFVQWSPSPVKPPIALTSLVK